MYIFISEAYVILGGHPLKYVRPTRGNSIKEDLILPISTVISYQQLLNECKDFLPSSPLHAGVLSGLPRYWTCCQNHYELICAGALLAQENTISL